MTPGETVYLTPREKEVLTWLSNGKTAEQVGDFLGCARATVECHKHRIMTKLGVPNVTAMVATALRGKIIE